MIAVKIFTIIKSVLLQPENQVDTEQPNKERSVIVVLRRCAKIRIGMMIRRRFLTGDRCFLVVRLLRCGSVDV